MCEGSTSARSGKQLFGSELSLFDLEPRNRRNRIFPSLSASCTLATVLQKRSPPSLLLEGQFRAWPRRTEWRRRRLGLSPSLGFFCLQITRKNLRTNSVVFLPG